MTLIPDLKGRRILLLTIIAILGCHITYAQAQSYCRPSLGSCCEWISNVTIGTLNHNSNNEPGYADYTAFSGTISKGTTYPISVKVSTNSIYIEHVKVFFDWDRDFIFESFVYLGSAKFTGTNIFTGNVTVPPNALDGCSMMRVFMQYAKEPAGACTSSGDGEVEDYTLVVGGSAVPVANFTLPNTSCSQENINFTNTSAITDNAPLNYVWNFGDGTTSTVASPDKTFTQPGTYQVNLTASTFCTTHSITKTIVVNPPPSITDHPVSSSVCVGGTATFNVTSSIPGATFQWQVDKGIGFADILSDATYKYSTTSALRIEGISADMHSYQYRCVVTKNCPIVSSTASLTILSPPVISAQPVDASVCQGGNTTLSVTASGTGILYQWQRDAGNGFEDLHNDLAHSNVATRLLTIGGISKQFEAYRYRCIVRGMCTSVSLAAKITVNNAPLLSDQPRNARILAGESAIFSVVASGEGLTYQWQKNTGTGYVDVIENDHYKNVKTSTLTINNALISDDSKLYRCVMAGVCIPEVISNPARLEVINPKPEISSLPITEVKEDSSYLYQLVVTDFTNRELVFSASKKPDWLIFDPHTHTLSGIPTNDNVGEHELILRVSNGLFETQQSFIINVVNVNDAPTITSIPRTTTKEDSVYEYIIRGYDIDRNDVLHLAVVTKPDWLSFDEHTGVLKGTPVNKDCGSWTVLLEVSDGHAAVAHQFLLFVENVNDAPVFTTDPLVIIDEDSQYRYIMAAEDVDKDAALKYLVLQKPEWLTFDGSTKTLHGTPTNNEVGIHAVKIQVSDGIISIDQDFDITVSNVNDAPVITSDAVMTVNRNESYQYVMKAIDPDGDELKYNVSAIPSWLTFDKQTAKLSGNSAVPGIYKVALTVSDGLLEVSQHFDVTVLQSSDSVETISLPGETNPTNISLSNQSFESTSSSNQVIGVFSTADEDVSNHMYKLVSGPGAQANSLFLIDDNNLYLRNRVNLTNSTEFSIRVRSTNSSGHFIEEIFILDKYDPEQNASGLEIPTTFSPNADGINDTWIIRDLQRFADVSIEVYDRSGVPLYKSTNPMEGWDGSVSGGSTMEGPFFYIVKVQDIVKKGVLIVIR